MNDISVTSNGNLIASASSDHSVRLWDNSNPWEGHTSQILKHNSAPVKSVDFTCDGKLLVTGSDDKTIKIINVSDRKLLLNLTGHENWIKCTRFSQDSHLIASCGDDRTARLWDVSTGINRSVFEHPGFVNCVRFHPDDSLIATSCFDKKIRVLDLI